MWDHCVTLRYKCDAQLCYKTLQRFVDLKISSHITERMTRSSGMWLIPTFQPQQPLLEVKPELREISCWPGCVCSLLLCPCSRPPRQRSGEHSRWRKILNGERLHWKQSRDYFKKMEWVGFTFQRVVDLCCLGLEHHCKSKTKCYPVKEK